MKRGRIKGYIKCQKVGSFIIKTCGGGGEIVVGKVRTQLIYCINFRKMGMMWLSKI
jgi:hypothetical protein